MYCFNCMHEAEARGVCPHCHKQNVPDHIPHHLPPGTILNGKYVVGNALGEGGFGITYVGLDNQLQMRVAIKEYYPLGNANRNNTQSNNVYTSTQSQSEQYDKGKERFMREAQSVAQFSGAQGVVNIKNYFEENNTAYIIMEYLEGENLLQHIKRHGNFAADKLFRLMLPMMKSLRDIHDKGVIHRDISPDNIIIHNDTLTLTDFGSARYYSNQSNEMSVMLKQGYAPEEQYRSTGNQGTWTDVYGLCATIYKCITGVTPQNGLDRAHVDQLKPPSELGANISKPLEAVLMYGMAVYHNDRCKDMNELMEMTQSALNNRDSNFPHSRIPVDTEKTVLANDVDLNTSHQIDNKVALPSCHRKQRQSKDQQKHNPPIIAKVSIALVAVVITIVVLILIFNKNDNNNTDTTTVAASPTVVTISESITITNSDNKASFNQSENDEVDLMKLHGISDKIENDFAGSWQIVDGEGKQYKNFVYMFDGTTKAVLMTGSVGQIAVYSVEEETDDKGNDQKVFTAQMVFGINGKYTFKFSEDKQKVVLTSLNDKKTTTMKKLASYEYIPIPDPEPKISKELLGAWKGDDGEMMYFSESGIMYDVMTGINFYFATYTADGKKASWSYSYSESNPKKESAEYSVKGDTLIFNGHDYKRVSPSELV